MTIKKTGYFRILCILFLLIIGCSQTVLAEDHTGSIHLYLDTDVQMETDKEYSFAVRKVADMLNGEFVLQEEYAKAAVEINTIDSAKELEKVIDILKKIDAKTDYLICIDQNGEGYIGDLPVGMYLIYSLEETSKEVVQPCLVTIPSQDETGKMNYDLQIYPKSATIEKETTVKTGDSSPIFYYCLFLTGAVILACLSLYQIYKQCQKKKR